MQKKTVFTLLLTSLFALVSLTLNAQQKEAEPHGVVNTQEGISGMIDHHLKDSHYFNFFSDGKTGEHYGFSLPVILWDKESGLEFFSASKFNYEENLVKVDGNYYKLHHAKIYKTDAKGTITYGDDGYPSNERPIDFSITKNVVTMLLIALFLLLAFSGLARSYKKSQVPKGFSRFLEPLVVYVNDEIAKPNIGVKYKKYTSFLMTVFFLILIMNLLGVTPLGVNLTGNITVTFCLALFTFVIVQFSGNKNYWKHVFWFPDVHWILKIILIPIEILGLFTKPFALMIRLFANMTAGHVVIMSLLSLIVVFHTWLAGTGFFGFTLFIAVMEVFIAFLQAYIFTLLSALYIGMAVEEHNSETSKDNDEIPII